MPISDTALRALKPKAKPFKLSDGGGLHILVTTAGGKHWKLAYSYGGKQKTLALGSYPYVTLAEARIKREDAKQLLANDVDPSAAKKEIKVNHTFEVVAREWYAKQADEWAKSHADRLMARFEADVFPHIGHLDIAKVESVDLLALLNKVEARGALDVTKRIRQTCGQVFRYGIATSRCKHDPSSVLRDALKKSPKVKHFASLKVRDMPEFLTRLDASEGEPYVRLAILFTLTTFVRTSETRFAAWSEFENLDGAEPLWRIPKERMKMGREHIVPLSRQALVLLSEIKALSGGIRFLFPSYGREGVMSQNGMIERLYKMGYRGKLTVHGFRGTASTVLNENEFNRDHIERQLAHVEEDEVRGAYNSAEWLPQRRVMMQWWADFIDGQRVAAIQQHVES